MMTTNNDNPVTLRYQPVFIQNGVTPNSTSRVVPPPIAVTKPTENAPNQSKFFAAASRMPLMANATVPMISIIVRNVNSIG